MLMGLGSTIGVWITWHKPFISINQFLFFFLLNVLLVGAFYGMLWSIWKSIEFRKRFSREWKRANSVSKISRMKVYLLFVIFIGFAACVFIHDIKFRIIILSIMFVVVATFYIWIFIKTVEKTSMLKSVLPKNLTEGDWIVNDIYVGKEYIAGPVDLGISKSQIRKVMKYFNKGKIKRVLIKEGIPFVPSFFIAFLVTLTLGHPLVWVF